jgi:alpha-glucosidase (family GH31 glycosyl hydrolase)
VKFYNSTKMVINYITIGGALEFYVFLRGSAQDIISRYQGLVGMPMMPPYYALGVFHGSNAYASWDKIKNVFDGYNGALTSNKIALEGVFVENFNQGPHWSFTVNPSTYPNLAAEIAKIHGNNQRLIFGGSFAINTDPAYPYMQLAKDAQCLVRSHASISVGPLLGLLNQTLVNYLDTYNGCFDTWLGAALPGLI